MRTPLTDKQADALRLIAAGYSITQAAEKLGVSRATVKDRLAVARNKLDALTTIQAVSSAHRAGVLT